MELADIEMNTDERASFGNPDWKRIRESGWMSADMHVHTNCSDSYSDVRRLINLSKSRQVGMAITDHNLITSLKKIDLKKEETFIIPGMEVSTSDGPHILTYFYDMRDLESFWERNIRPRLQACPWLALRDCSTEQLLDMLEGENCVVSGAHPMGYLGSNKGVEICNIKGYIPTEVVERLDAYEVICGGMTRKDNIETIKASERHGLCITGGSDAHVAEDLGSVVSISPATDIDGFLRSVLNRTNHVMGLEKDFQRRALTGLTSFYHFMDHAPSVVFVQSKQTFKTIKRGMGKKKER